MPRNLTSTLAIVLLVLLAVPASAQEPEEEDFQLLRDSAVLEMEQELEEKAAQHWDRQLQTGKLELSFALGFLNLGQVMLEHQQIIYKYTDAATYWGDLTLTGDSAFSPSLRVNYNFNAWFALEALANISFAEYQGDAVNRKRRPNDEGAEVDADEPDLEEYDMENRSLSGFLGAANAVIYPFNFDGDAMGRWHPFITLGVGRVWYSMNSAYIDDAASGMDYSAGLGIRMMVDRSAGLRFDLTYHTNEVQFTPSESFAELNEGTKIVPLDEFPEVDGVIQQQQVTEYSKTTVSSFQWSIGFQVTF